MPYDRTNAGVFVDIVTNGSGVIRQVKSPQGLINIAIIDSYKYQLQMFYGSNVTAKSGGLYGTNGSAFDVWTIANPNGPTNSNQLTVTESRPGMADRIFTYTLNNSSGTNIWQMIDSEGLRTVQSWQTSSDDPIYGTVTNLFQQITSGTNVLKMVQKTYAAINGMQMLTQQIDGSGTTTNITDYYYNSQNLVQQINYPNGNWELFFYDGNNRITSRLSAFGASPAPALGSYPNLYFNPFKEIDYVYDNAYVTGDHIEYQPAVARREIVSMPTVDGSFAEVSRIFRSAPYADEVDEYQCPTPGGSWEDATNQVTKTVTFVDWADLNTYGKIKWQINVDQTATSYTYQEDANGALTNIITQIGQPNDLMAPTNIIDGWQISVAINAWGQSTMVTKRVITGGAPGVVFNQDTYIYTDGLQMDHNVVDLANRTNQFHYACCGLESTTDPDGVSTTYTYDTLKRLIATTTFYGTNGITITNTLDASGRILVRQRIGSDGSAITNSQMVYDVLGRAMRITNALNGVTTITNVVVDGQRYVTNTYPDGGTRIEAYYSDGRLQNVTGTAVRPMQYLYGAEPDGDGGPYRPFTLTVLLAEDGGTNEWTKTYSDGVGHVYKTIYAGASSNPFSLSSFNSFGQLTNTTDPDGVSELYAYNEKGEQTYFVVDANQDYNIDFSGSDRISLVTNDVVNSHGFNVRRSRTYVWNTVADAPLLLSMMETSIDGLKSWSTIYNNGSSTVSSNVTVYDAVNHYRYETNVAPDGSYTLSTFQFGRLQSVLRQVGITQLSYVSLGYDYHGRKQTVIDAGIGTTTRYYNVADQVTNTILPAVNGVAQSTKVYVNNALQVYATQMADNTWLTNLYTPRGELQLTYGSRTYPVSYSYDAQGRMKTMTTWKNAASGAGAAVTTWNYDQYRGFLLSKVYDGGFTGPSYKYTAAGRLQIRFWARGINTTNVYNNAGDLAGVFYSDGVTAGITNGYDRLGRLNVISNSPSVCSLAYNDVGELLREIYIQGPLAGLSVTNGYDSLLRRSLLTTLNPLSSVLVSTTYGYDAASRLQTVSDGTNLATYTYLTNSPLVSQIDFANNGTPRMMTTKGYDALNRLTNITSIANSTVVASFSYGINNANQRTSVTNVDDTRWVYQYDNLGQVTSGKKYWNDGTVVAGQQFQYAFDDIGNRTSTDVGGDQSGANLRHSDYNVDNLNRYSSRTVPNAVDVMGSALSNATVTVNDQRVYRNNDYFRKELAVTNGAGPVWLAITNLAVLNNGSSADTIANTSGNVFIPKNQENFTYDADGNLTSDGRWTNRWDAENRLISVESLTNGPAGSKLKLLFGYDFKGRRISKTVSNWTGSAWALVLDQRFVYDGWNLQASLTSSLSLQTSFMWGLDLSGTLTGAGGVGGLLAISQPSPANSQHFVSCDGNGNVCTLINAGDSSASCQYEYGPFGEVIRATGAIAKANPFRFSTKYQDDESDLLYYGYRFYSQSQGRWLSRDPMEERGSCNLYNLIDSDAVNFIDALGLLKVLWAPEQFDPNLKDKTTGKDEYGEESIETDGYTLNKHHCGICGQKYDPVSITITIHIKYRSQKDKKSKGPSGLTTEQHEKSHAQVDIDKYTQIEQFINYYGSFCLSIWGKCNGIRDQVMNAGITLAEAAADIRNSKVDLADFVKGTAQYSKEEANLNAAVGWFNDCKKAYDEAKKQWDAAGCAK